jgi:hypothetical protein
MCHGAAGPSAAMLDIVSSDATRARTPRPGTVPGLTLISTSTPPDALGVHVDLAVAAGPDGVPGVGWSGGNSSALSLAASPSSSTSPPAVPVWRRLLPPPHMPEPQRERSNRAVPARRAAPRRAWLLRVASREPPVAAL